MKIVSTNIGKKTDAEWQGGIISTGIFKKPVEEPLYLDSENVKGDVICDRTVHGGINQAVYIYGEQHYAYWRELYPNLEIDYGMLGENLTVSSFEEIETHTGDQFMIGEAIIEATYPREPCIKLGIKFDSRKAMRQMLKTTKCGVYFKVIKKGYVKTGDTIKRIKHCSENKTIAELFKTR